MKIPLQKPDDIGSAAAFVRDSEPFVTNKLGKLVHRPKSAKIYSRNGCIKPHMAVHYHCGNCAVGDFGKLTFVPEPDADALLCKLCEEKAVLDGLPSANDIVGRHVHVGKLRAFQVCCDGGVSQ